MLIYWYVHVPVRATRVAVLVEVMSSIFFPQSLVVCVVELRVLATPIQSPIVGQNRATTLL